MIQVISNEADKQYLDVSQLEPPEPMTAILDALDELPSGGFLYVYHSREPFLLYNVLQKMDMKWLTRCDNDGMFHIVIWPESDLSAEEKALASINQD